MKYWCYYTDVVRYLERIEAGQSQKTAAPAYLIWQDDDGPSMIIGPGVEWYRGNGPPPDIDAITVSAGRPLAPAPPERNTQSRKTWRAHSCVPCRHSWRHVLAPRPAIAPIPPAHLRSARQKGEQKEYEFSKTRSNLLTPPQETTEAWTGVHACCGRQPAVKTPNDPASIKSRTAASRAAASP